MKIDKEILFEDIKKIPGLLLAFLFCAYGIAQMKNLNLGMNPWGTFHIGLSYKTGLQFGTISQLVGLVLIVISLFFKIYPGIGTILNMYFIGLFVNIIDKYSLVFVPENYLLRIIALFWGLTVFSYGIYSYLRFGLGAGPRDGLMVGLMKITGIRVTYIKPAIEITVLFIGFLLGGTVGIGTIIVTFFGGYILNIIFKWKDFDPKKINQRKLSDYMVKKEQNPL